MEKKDEMLKIDSDRVVEKMLGLKNPKGHLTLRKDMAVHSWNWKGEQR